jgi:hypothetical protein
MFIIFPYVLFQIFRAVKAPPKKTGSKIPLKTPSQEDSKIAAQASEHKWQAWKQLLGNVQVMQQTVAQRFGGSKSARGWGKIQQLRSG